MNQNSKKENGLGSDYPKDLFPLSNWVYNKASLYFFTGPIGAIGGGVGADTRMNHANPDLYANGFAHIGADAVGAAVGGAIGFFGPLLGAFYIDKAILFIRYQGNKGKIRRHASKPNRKP